MKKIVLNTYDLSDEKNLSFIPDYFYKYTKVTDNLKTNLQNNQLWFASPNTFNDPFDCKAYLNYGSTTEECRENFNKFNSHFNIKLPENNKKIWDTLLENPEDFNLVNSYSAQKNFEEWLGVTCFSETYKNVLMWSHYADSHSGLVLEFRKDLAGFLTRNLLPVNYFKSYPIINVSDYTEEQMIAIVYQVICAKAKAWKYEKEWRAIVSNGNSLNKFNKNELSAVIFGLNTPKEVKKEIFDLILSSGYANVSFKEATFESRKFKVKYADYVDN